MKKDKSKKEKVVEPEEQEVAEAAGEEAAVDSEEPREAEVVEPEVAEEEAEPDYEALYKEANDKYLRSLAERKNYQKRTQRQLGDVRIQAKMSTVEEFLTVYDYFQMALEHADSDDGSTLRQGMEMIRNEFAKTLESVGAVEIKTIGEAFDPNRHEAVSQEPSDEIPEGHIIRQWKSGFSMGERLLRPATVVVSTGSAAKVEATEANTESQE